VNGIAEADAAIYDQGDARSRGDAPGGVCELGEAEKSFADGVLKPQCPSTEIAGTEPGLLDHSSVQWIEAKGGENRIGSVESLTKSESRRCKRGHDQRT
jgi:hypothetical protein